MIQVQEAIDAAGAKPLSSRIANGQTLEHTVFFLPWLPQLSLETHEAGHTGVLLQENSMMP